MKKIAMMLIFAFVILPTLLSQVKERGLEAVTRRAVEGQLEFLASDWTEGRGTASKGEYIASDYIASMFKVYGLEPGGDWETEYPDRAARVRGEKPERYRSYFQKFNLIEYSTGEKQEFSLINETDEGSSTILFGNRTDFSVSTSDLAIEITAPVVFVGYGYVNEDAGYDDFKNVEVDGKVILRLYGYPGSDDEDSRAFKTINPDGRLSSWRISRKKNEEASKRGAVAVIEVSGRGAFGSSWVDNVPFRYNSRMYEGDEPTPTAYGKRMSLPGNELTGLTRISVSKRALNVVLEGTGVDPEAFAEKVKEDLKPASVDLKGKKVHIKTSVDSRMVQVRNVVGVIPGKDSSGMIIVGGHYDHMGIHEGYIWNGTDDNASGTVGAMTIAKACMATGEQPEKTLVFAAWTAEEKGLIGSRYFADNPYNEMEMLAYLNYDMISRDNADDSLGVNCSMVYTEAYPNFEDMSIQHNEDYELGLEIRFRPSERPSGGSDHSSFAGKDVPVMYFMAGFPPEYHQPDDHVEKVNWDKMVNIIKIGYLNIWELANSSW